MTSVTEAPPGRDWITRSYEVRKSVAAYTETRGSGEHSEFLQSCCERGEQQIIWCGLCKWWMRDYSVRVRRKRSSVPTVCRSRRWPVAGRHLTAGSFWEVSVDALMLSACIPTQPVSFSLILSCAQFVGRFVMCVKFNIQPCACPPPPVWRLQWLQGQKAYLLWLLQPKYIHIPEMFNETKLVVNCASSRETSTAIKAS